MVLDLGIIVGASASITAILVAGKVDRHPPERGHRRNWIRVHIFKREEKAYARREGVDSYNPDCLDPGCRHPEHALHYKIPPQHHAAETPISEPQSPFSPEPPQQQPTTNIQITPEAIVAFFDGLGIRHQGSSGPGVRASSTTRNVGLSPITSATNLSAGLPQASTAAKVQENVNPEQRAISPLGLGLRRWQRAAPGSSKEIEPPSTSKFAKYNVQAEAPTYDNATYESHLTDPDWTKIETDYLIDTYRDCNGKWPVIIDRYDSEHERSMEDLKARFYGVSAQVMSLTTPISNMTGPEYALYDTLAKFDPLKEASRKKLAEGHLQRKQNEVDEESVLLGELQRIMLNQANLDSDREDLRRRLDHPLANTNGYQYSTSQALTTLWQQLLAADRMKKTQRLRPTGNPAYDGFPNATPTSARPRDSNAGLPDMTNMAGRRPTRDSLPSAATPSNALPADMSKAELARFGVLQAQDKLPSGVTFASDRLSKPRVAKSTQQTEKIANILSHIGVPDLIPLATPAVVEQFDAIMGKVHTLLDMRKLAEREESEIKTRAAEAS